MIKYQTYGIYPPSDMSILNPYGGIGGYDINAGQPGEKRYIETDPRQSINTLTGEEDEPTTGSTPPGASGPTIDIDPNKNVAGNWYEEFPDPNKEKADEIMRYAENYTKNCPKGQKWDPVKQQCYKEKYVTGQPVANLMLAGLHGINRLMDSKNQFKDNLKSTNASLADAQVPVKAYNGVDFYGYEDVNTFTPNPRYGTYNRSVYQPGAEYAKMRFGGFPMHQTAPGETSSRRRLDPSEYESATGQMLPPSRVSSVSEIRTVSGQDPARGKYYDQNTEKWSNVDEEGGNTLRSYTRGSTDAGKAPFMEYFSQGPDRNQLRFISDDGTTAFNKADPFMQNFLDRRIDYKAGAMNRKKGGDVHYLTKSQIEQILRDGGEIEFLN